MNRFGMKLQKESEPITIAGSGEQYAQFMFLEPNTDESFYRYGKEKGRRSKDNIIKLVGSNGSIRYLYQDPETYTYIGGLQLVKEGIIVTVSTIFTDVNHRGEGIATTLIKKAMKAYRNRLVLSNHFTEQGSTFFKVKKAG